jgi:hypothetical protein
MGATTTTKVPGVKPFGRFEPKAGKKEENCVRLAKKQIINGQMLNTYDTIFRASLTLSQRLGPEPRGMPTAHLTS